MSTINESSELRARYKRLLEADGEPELGTPNTEQPAQPVEENPEMQANPDAPELQNTSDAEAMPQEGFARQINIPRFSPNMHRFAYNQGEEVEFYDENGDLVRGSIVGPPAGDRFDVVDTDGTQHEVIKSELFYPAQQDQQMVDGESANAQLEDSR
jgi:hypothetical protein